MSRTSRSPTNDVIPACAGMTSGVSPRRSQRAQRKARRKTLCVSFVPLVLFVVKFIGGALRLHLDGARYWSGTALCRECPPSSRDDCPAFAASSPSAFPSSAPPFSTSRRFRHQRPRRGHQRFDAGL